MTNLLNVNPLYFYIGAIVCFCAFVVYLLFYLLKQKNGTNKQTKNWTIESAKKFLESQNIDIKTVSNEKVISDSDSESKKILNKLNNSKEENLDENSNEINKTKSEVKQEKAKQKNVAKTTTKKIKKDESSKDKDKDKDKEETKVKKTNTKKDKSDK